MASVRRCIDCDQVLVDDVGPATDDEVTSGASPLGSGDQIAYELEGWGNQLKVTLEGMLVRQGIRRVWEAGALVVAAADEEVVDGLIATLEGDAVEELDDEGPRIAFEIEGLDADGQAELDARLIAEAVPHAWDDDGALLVAEADGDRVTELIEAVLDAEEEHGADDDGLAAIAALSDLYVATDRLVKNPTERKQATSYVVAQRALDGGSLPYGFATDDWDHLRSLALDLAEQVTPYADPAALAEAAPSDDADEVDGDAEVDIEAEADADDLPVPDDGPEVDDDDEPEVDDEPDVEDGDTDDDDGEADAEGDDAEASVEERARNSAEALRDLLLDYV